MHAPQHDRIIVRLNAVHAGAGDRAEVRRRALSVLSDLLASPPGLELTSSCTHALEAAATVLEIGPGDEVIVPAFSFPSTANAFVLHGATVRFADLDPSTGNVDPVDVERCVGERTKAIVCMHYGGVACDMEAISEICARHDLRLVEDAAHALFASYRGVPLGRFGDLSAFSFHRTKNISAVDGGALVVNDPGLVESVEITLDKGTNRVAFESGRVRSYEWCAPGSAWHMSDPIVERLAEQLEQRDAIQSRRHEVWATYAAELTDWARSNGARLADVPEGAEHPAHLYWVVLGSAAERDRFVEWCGDRGVEVARHYGSLPLSAYGRRIAHPEDDCPEAGRFADGLTRLPVHQDLSDGDVERVLDAVRSFRAKNSP